jgi:hypothetical protein
VYYFLACANFYSVRKYYLKSPLCRHNNPVQIKFRGTGSFTFNMYYVPSSLQHF